MRLILATVVACGLGSIASAAPYGPEPPPVTKATLVQQSAALYRDKYRHGYVPCPAPTHANEVVICGNGRGGSAERLPLPDERGPRWPAHRYGRNPQCGRSVGERRQLRPAILRSRRPGKSDRSGG